MSKPKLNDPDVEITTTTIGESITINKTIPSKQFKDIFVTDTAVREIYPTLEQVKKEWEELGYEWKEDEFYITLRPSNSGCWLSITKKRKNYLMSGTHISFEIHQLLTKTFRALGWI